MSSPARSATLRALLALALPMVLARATQAVITFADALQVKHLVVRVWHGGPVGAMICLVCYLALLALALALRFRSGAWRKIDLIEPVLV